MARGHIRKRGSGYSIVVELPKDPVTGKRRQKWFTARTKKEAEALLSEELAKLHRGEWFEASSATFDEYAHRWLDTIKAEREVNTFHNYESALRLHVLPKIGTVQLGKLSPLRIQELYDDLRNDGLGQTRLNQVHRILHSALKQAVYWQLISRNPCDSVAPPKRVKPKVRFWDRATVNRFLEATKDDDFGPYWSVLVSTGLRRAELCGLHWSDIDFDRRILRVSHQVKRDINGELVIGKLKTSAGTRAVPLTSGAVAALKTQRKNQNTRRLELGEHWQDNELVFDHYDGGPWSPSALSAVFHRRVRQHDVPPLRLHDLRHTAASLMLAASLSLFEVSRILGHSSIAITADLYGHLAQDTIDQARQRLDAAFGA